MSCSQPGAQGMVQLQSSVRGRGEDGGRVTRSSPLRPASQKAPSWPFTPSPRPCGKEGAVWSSENRSFGRKKRMSHTQTFWGALGADSCLADSREQHLRWVRLRAALHPGLESQSCALSLGLRMEPRQRSPASLPRQRWRRYLARGFLAMSQVERQPASQAESGTL